MRLVEKQKIISVNARNLMVGIALFTLAFIGKKKIDVHASMNKSAFLG